MSKSLKTLGAVVGLVFALSFAAQNAHADTFTPVFNTTGCLGGPCLLPTAPDVTFPSPHHDDRNLIRSQRAGDNPQRFPPRRYLYVDSESTDGPQHTALPDF
jgi:hypothetical protein